MNLSSTTPVTGVYRLGAPLYDVLSGEWPVYRPGRLAGIAALGLQPGDTVLDVGCGTGLSIPLLAEAVGGTGQVIGLDSSAQMLSVAARRTRHHSGTITLIQADATTADLAGLGLPPPDGVLFCYSLSIMQPWRAAWDTVTSTITPGTRVVIVDLALPTRVTGILRSLARIACRVGGSDAHAQPWRALKASCDDVTTTSLRRGHIQIWSGTWRQAPHPVRDDPQA